MKRSTTGKAFAAFIAAGLVLTGCDQLAGIADGTGGGGTNSQVAGDITIDGTAIGNTELVTIANEDVTIGGTGEQGVFIANRTVQLSPYAIGKYEVTRRLYMEVMSRMYDDLKANGFVFTTEITEPGADATEADILKVKGQKAASFVEFLGGDLIKVRRGTQDYLGGIDFKDEQYFDEPNLNLPMTALQWHDAVVFTNYLSIITGKMPAYALKKYLGWEVPEQLETNFGISGEDLYLYNAEEKKSTKIEDLTAAEDTDLDKARRNPVSWMLDTNWKENYKDGQADALAYMGNFWKETYNLENVLVNQRVSFYYNANGYRLPTEAEWEYAARGANPSDDPESGSNWNMAFSGSDDPTEVANLSGTIANVGSLKANERGLHDMSGNASEWVYDLRGTQHSADYPWQMAPIAAAQETEVNPTRQVIDWRDGAMNDVWIPLTRIQRGGSYRDAYNNGDDKAYAVANVLTRSGRTRIFTDGKQRDGFIRDIWGGGEKQTGTATDATREEAKSVGLRLACYIIQ